MQGDRERILALECTGVPQGGPSSRGGAGRGRGYCVPASAPFRPSGPLARVWEGPAHWSLPVTGGESVPARFLVPRPAGGLPAPPPCSRALPPSSPPRAASSSSSSSLSLSICPSRLGIHSGLGAGAAWPLSAGSSGRLVVRPSRRLSAGASACWPAQVSPSPLRGPAVPASMASPRLGTTLASDRRAAGALAHPSNPHP